MFVWVLSEVVGAGRGHLLDAELECCFLCFGYKIHKVVNQFDILGAKFVLFVLCI